MISYRTVPGVSRLYGAKNLFAGEGSFATIAQTRATRIVLLCSKSSYESDYLQKMVTKVAKRVSIQVIQVSGEPTVDNIIAEEEKVKDFAPDWIVAVGGGSTIDLAKLIWAYYEEPWLEIKQARFSRIDGLRGKALFCACPTTYGSGSEASLAAVFQPDSEGSKSFCVSEALLPDIAILDPMLSED